MVVLNYFTLYGILSLFPLIPHTETMHHILLALAYKAQHVSLSRLVAKKEI